MYSAPPKSARLLSSVESSQCSFQSVLNATIAWSLDNWVHTQVASKSSSVNATLAVNLPIWVIIPGIARQGGARVLSDERLTFAPRRSEPRRKNRRQHPGEQVQLAPEKRQIRCLESGGARHRLNIALSSPRNSHLSAEEIYKTAGVVGAGHWRRIKPRVLQPGWATGAAGSPQPIVTQNVATVDGSVQNNFADQANQDGLAKLACESCRSSRRARVSGARLHSRGTRRSSAASGSRGTVSSDYWPRPCWLRLPHKSSGSAGRDG